MAFRRKAAEVWAGPEGFSVRPLTRAFWFDLSLQTLRSQKLGVCRQEVDCGFDCVGVKVKSACPPRCFGRSGGGCARSSR